MLPAAPQAPRPGLGPKLDQSPHLTVYTTLLLHSTAIPGGNTLKAVNYNNKIIEARERQRTLGSVLGGGLQGARPRRCPGARAVGDACAWTGQGKGLLWRGGAPLRPGGGRLWRARGGPRRDRVLRGATKPQLLHHTDSRRGQKWNLKNSPP